MWSSSILGSFVHALNTISMCTSKYPQPIRERINGYCDTLMTAGLKVGWRWKVTESMNLPVCSLSAARDMCIIHRCTFCFEGSLTEGFGFFSIECRLPKRNLIEILSPLHRPALISWSFLSWKSSGNICLISSYVSLSNTGTNYLSYCLLHIGHV